MRATQVYQLLERTDFAKLDAAFPTRGRLNNLSAFRDELTPLFKIPGYEADFDAIKESIVFRTAKDTIDIPADEWDVIRRASNRLTFFLQGLKKYLETFVQSESAASVFVKLPEFNQLPEFIQFLDRLNKVLDQTVTHPAIGGKIEMRSWEKGSFWVEIYVGSAAGVMLLGSLAWSAAVVRKKWHEGSLIEQHVRTLDIKNEMLEQLSELQQKAIQKIIEGEAINVEAEHYQNRQDPELTARLKFAITEIAKMLDRGAEIHPALNAPESVHNLFPDFKNLLGVESKTKLISDGAAAGDSKGAKTDS